MSTCATRIRICGRVMALGVFALALSACSRTVKWEEEVPLNTGETIWIQREMKWAMLGGLGNPFDIALRPTREQIIRFTYGGRQYEYAGRANIRWIAISADKTPTLVAMAADFNWAGQHHFYCVVPYYVQFVPDETGRTWRWPEQIDAWLYHRKANVMASVPTPNKNRNRYSAQDRDAMDATYRNKVPEGAVIDPSYTEESCIHKW